MSGKVAKMLRARARKLAKDNSNELLQFGGRREWAGNSYRGIYLSLKKIYKRTGRIA